MAIFIWINLIVALGLVFYVVGSLRRVERRLETIERVLGARHVDL